jgi:D-alanyl-D-alanine carboxypeptidase
LAPDPEQASAIKTNQKGGTMKSRIYIVALALMTLPLFAHASCDSVKTAIDAKIKANGVDNFSLDVVTADQADKSGDKVVGRCEGDKAIVYSRGQSSAGGDNTSSAPKESPATADKSTATTTSPDNAQRPPAPIVGRSGQTGG